LRDKVFSLSEVLCKRGEINLLHCRFNLIRHLFCAQNTVGFMGLRITWYSS
jgi:hypothetical protein